MSKFSFLISELLRSFRKSIFKDIVLMVMFTISIIMSVIMCSHYLDINDKLSELVQKAGDSSWYHIDACSQGEGYISGLSTVSGSRNLMNYYEEITGRDKFSIFSVNPNLYLYMKEEDFEQHIGTQNGKGFLNFNGDQHVGSQMFDKPCKIVTVNCMGVDLNAYRLFGLRTNEGQDFNDDNLTIDNATDCIPIILGSNYRDYFEIGDTIELTCGVHDFLCRVLGVLERETKIPKVNNMYQESELLDDFIVFPMGIRVKNESDISEDIEKYAYKDWETMAYGIIQINDEVKMNEVVYDIDEVSRKYGFEPIRIVGTSLGINIFRNESEITIKVMLILTIVMVIFSFYGLFVTFYDKVQSNGREYGIYLMNGCGIKMILSTCLLEVALIICPALLISRCLFSVSNFGYYNFYALFQVVYLLVGVTYLIGAGFVIYIFRGVDIEHLIRRKE